MNDLLSWVYERLTLNVPPEPADLIFVLAGKMERKAYGLELYNCGIASRLLLSVGRFEVSKTHPLRLAFEEELISKRNATPPQHRHFFCEMDPQGSRIIVPKLLKWNTYGEALGLRAYLGNHPAKNVIVVSTDIHLRRVALTLRKMFASSEVQFQYCSVPQGQSSLSKKRWWTRREDRRYVISETMKLIGYHAMLLLPESIIGRCLKR